MISPVFMPKRGVWLMGVFAYFDDSGKEDDKNVICLGCVAAFQERFDDFHRDWKHLLEANGLAVVSGKDVFNYNKPLSEKNPAFGVEARTAALLPFVLCIRKQLHLISGTVIDIKEWKQVPSHLKQFVGNNALFMAFLRSVLFVYGFASDAVICLAFDEDNETTEPYYKLYKRVKKILPGADKKLAAITFADDRSLYALQAADLVGGLIRLQYDAVWNGAAFDYRALYDELVKPGQPHERLWELGIPEASKDTLQKLVEDLKKLWEQEVAKGAHPEK
jgi:hypothetical protein